MFEKLTDAIWKMRTPKKYREYTKEALMLEYEEMRREFEQMVKDESCDGEALLQFLEKHHDLMEAVYILDKQMFEKLLWRK